MAIIGQTVSVTATVQNVTGFGDPLRRHTIINDDSTNPVYFRYKSVVNDTFQGTDAQLRGKGGVELLAGEWLTLDPPLHKLEMVCATGETATVRILPGQYNAIAV